MIIILNWPFCLKEEDQNKSVTITADGEAVLTDAAEDAEAATEEAVKITANPNRKKKKKRKQ